MIRKNAGWALVFGAFFYSSIFGFLTPDDSLAQSAFYEGKTITIVVGTTPGGVGDMRVRATVSVLQKHVPGNPHFLVEFMPGGGGRKAGNYMYRSARADGLTIGAMTPGFVPAVVLGETGVLYDLDKFIYLGAHQSGRPSVFLTNKKLGLNNLEKLRASSGLRIGAHTVGHVNYYGARVFSYLVGLKDPKWVTGYSGPETDVAIVSGELDGQITAVHHMLVRRSDWIENDLMDFHAIIEVPKGRGHPHPRFARLPDFSAFAKSEMEHKLIRLYRDLQTVAFPLVLPPGTPGDRVRILQEALRKTFEDPQFHQEYQKRTGEEPTPQTPAAFEKLLGDLPRDPEVIGLFRTLAGPDPMPARR